MDDTLKILSKLQKFNLFIIALGAVITLLVVLKLQYLPQVQFLVMTIMIMFYLLWALAHHFIDKSLTLEIVIEYVLTALLALIILYGILL